MGNSEHIEQYYFDIIDEILSVINNGEPILTFSLDSNNVLFSTCFIENNNAGLIEWHLAHLPNTLALNRCQKLLK